MKNFKLLVLKLILLNHAYAFDLSINGNAEVIFDYTTDRCEQFDIPDSPAAAVRTRKGIKLISSSYNTYVSKTRDFQDFGRNCERPLFQSRYSDNYYAYRDREWPTSFKVSWKNPNLIYTLIHGEFHGHERYSQCNNDYLACWQNYLTEGISYNGLESIESASINMIATTTPRYLTNRGPMGVFHPSNIVRKVEADGKAYYYFMAHVEARKDTLYRPLLPYEQQTGVCLFRSKESSRTALPDGNWLAWDGLKFSANMKRAEVCQVVSKPQIFKMSRSLVEIPGYGYLLVGTVGGSNPGTYYSVSTDLINWSPRRLLIAHRQPGGSGQVAYAHPRLIDHRSRSLDFSSIDLRRGEIYLYMTRFNSGWALDRDLVRFKIQVD